MIHLSKALSIIYFVNQMRNSFSLFIEPILKETRLHFLFNSTKNENDDNLIKRIATFQIVKEIKFLNRCSINIKAKN